MIFYFSLRGGLLTCKSFLYCFVNLLNEAVFFCSFFFGGQGISFFLSFNLTSILGPERSI